MDCFRSKEQRASAAHHQWCCTTATSVNAPQRRTTTLFALPAHLLVEDVLIENQVLTLVITSTLSEMPFLIVISPPAAYTVVTHATFLICLVRDAPFDCWSRCAASSATGLPASAGPLRKHSLRWLRNMLDAPAVRQRACVASPTPLVAEREHAR